MPKGNRNIPRKRCKNHPDRPAQAFELCNTCYKREHPQKPRQRTGENKAFRSPGAHRKHSLKSKYGITLEQYDEMFRNQAGVCVLCHLPQINRFLVVDHDHKTGKVRSLLCYRCNLLVGLMEGFPGQIYELLTYTEQCGTVN